MPAAFVKKVLDGDEKAWDQAKASAEKYGHSGDYEYIAGVAKKIHANRMRSRAESNSDQVASIVESLLT